MGQGQAGEVGRVRSAAGAERWACVSLVSVSISLRDPDGKRLNASLGRSWVDDLANRNRSYFLTKKQTSAPLQTQTLLRSPWHLALLPQTSSGNP